MTTRQVSMKNMDILRSKSNSAVVLGTEEPEGTPDHSKTMQSFTTAQCCLSSGDATVDPFDQKRAVLEL